MAFFLVLRGVSRSPFRLHHRIGLTVCWVDAMVKAEGAAPFVEPERRSLFRPRRCSLESQCSELGYGAQVLQHLFGIPPRRIARKFHLKNASFNLSRPDFAGGWQSKRRGRSYALRPMIVPIVSSAASSGGKSSLDLGQRLPG